MLTHRLMIAKRLYSILKRNVINRFVRIFVLLFISLSCALSLPCFAQYKAKSNANASAIASRYDEDFTLYSTNFVFLFRIRLGEPPFRHPNNLFSHFRCSFDTINFIFVR